MQFRRSHNRLGPRGPGGEWPSRLKRGLTLVYRVAIRRDKCKDQLRFDPCTQEADGGG